MKPHGLEPIAQATMSLARKSSPKGTVIMRLREAVGPIYQDEHFAHLFAKRGRPAEAPWRLALVTVFQAMENLSDRQAAQMVALRLDWKYAGTAWSRRMRALITRCSVNFASDSLSTKRPSWCSSRC